VSASARHERNFRRQLIHGVTMQNQALDSGLGHVLVNGVGHDNDHAIFERSEGKDASLEQVREILFGAESRRSEAERRALEINVAERFARLEADYERRFEKLLQDLHQRFEKSCAMLEAESAERRQAMRIQHDELVAQLETAAQSLAHAKTGREELAAMLNDVANRLRGVSLT
jgi:hypothetical protein